MIGRFRNNELSSQPLLTIAAGLLIGVCWFLRLWFSHPTVEIVLALIATVLCGGPIIRSAIKGLVHRKVNVDELVSLAIIAALIIGEYLTAATVGFIMVLGSLLESYTSTKARRAIQSLVELTPDTARLLLSEGEKIVPVGEVQAGQRILVKPGEKIAVDGQVMDGNASVDQATVTGEPIPVDVAVGNEVFAGTFVQGGALTLEATRVGEDSTLGKIIKLVEEADTHQAEIVRQADAFAKWFTPAILAIAAGVWIFSGEFIRCVSVLVVGCPCALILATPTAVVAAMGVAARRGLMIKGGKYLEALGKIDAVAFDKTGTLTEGKPEVREIITFDGSSESEVLSWAAAVERHSEHPLGQAVVREAQHRDLACDSVEQFESQTGLGVSGIVNGSVVKVGRAEYAGEAVPNFQNDGQTMLWVSRGDECVGGIALGDHVRHSASVAVEQLKALGISSLHLLSGDRKEVVGNLATEVGIQEWDGELLPHEKVAAVSKLRDQGKKVMYVGDGINDAPALATSHVGVAMSAAASPIALETAPIAILNDDVQQVPTLIELGRLANRRIKQNLLYFAVLFNGIALILAGLGVLSPIMAALTHNAGSVAVVLNSARLIRWRPGNIGK